MTHAIYPLPVCQMFGSKGIFLYRFFSNEMIWFPIFTWLIDTGKEKILIDCPGSAHDMEKYSASKFAAKDINYMEDNLTTRGISPEEVTTIIVTHLHHDHITGAKKFPNARFIIQEKELAFASNPHPLFHKSFPNDIIADLKFEPVHGDSTIFPGIDVLLTPGHTPGSQSVAITTRSGKAIIAGFCSIKETFFPPDTLSRGLPVVPPGFLVNSLQAYDSALKIKEGADILIPLHDEEFVSREIIS